MFKVNNKNTRTTCEICSKLTIKTGKWRQMSKLGKRKRIWRSILLACISFWKHSTYKNKLFGLDGFTWLPMKIQQKITAQKMKFFIKDFFSKCDQIRRKLRKQEIFNGKLLFLRSVRSIIRSGLLRIWSHLLKKSLKVHSKVWDNFWQLKAL